MRLILKPIALQFFKRVKEGRETYHRTHYTKHLFIIIKQWNMAQIICKEKLYYIYNLIKSHNSPSNLKWIENKIEFNCDRSLLIIWAWTWIHVSQFEGIVKSVNDNFPIFWILSEKLANFCVISREITKITGIRRERDITIYNWSETWFSEMLKIAFKCEFSMNMNLLVLH